MTFAWPQLLWLLLLPALLLLLELGRGRRQIAQLRHPKILRGRAGASSLELEPAQPPIARSLSRLPRLGLHLGLALCLLALARPQWGKTEERVFDQSREILLALDLSKSMLTQDVKPSRLERARLLVQVLLDRLRGERVGLLVFAGTAFLQCPLSSDYEILREFLPNLDTRTLPQGGSNYEALLTAANEAFSSTRSADRFLIILSDGEATEESWRTQLETLQKNKVRVLALGLGTPTGAMIPDGEGGLVKDERGAVVLSKLEPRTLQELAQSTEGLYRDASDWVDLADLVKQTVEKGSKGRFADQRETRAIDRFQWVLAPALACLLLSLARDFPRPVAPRPLVLRGPGTVSKTALLLGLLALGLHSGPPLLAQVPPEKPEAEPQALAPLGTAAKPTPPPPQATDKPTHPLGFAVERLSSKAHLEAKDCAELAQETLNWARNQRATGTPLPDGPLRDGLAAVDLGEGLEPKAADWEKLREELEKLREKPPEQKPKEQDKNEQPKTQDPNQKPQESPKDSQQEPKDGEGEKQPQEPKSSGSKETPKQDKDPQSEPQETPAQTENNPQKEKAFGDLDQKDSPPEPKAEPPKPRPEELKQVGGEAQERAKAAEKTDPGLLVPLQKMEKLKDQDSPALLFQRLQPQKRPSQGQPKKDW